MERRTRFEGIVRGMTAVASWPVTVKMRTGVHHKNWNAHKLLPRLQDWGVAMATVSVVTLELLSATTDVEYFLSSFFVPPLSFVFFSYFSHFALFSPLSVGHWTDTREISGAAIHKAGRLGLHISVCCWSLSSARVWMWRYPLL